MSHLNSPATSTLLAISQTIYIRPAGAVIISPAEIHVVIPCGEPAYKIACINPVPVHITVYPAITCTVTPLTAEPLLAALVPKGL